MQCSSARRLDGGLIERDLVLDDVPGILWTPGHDAAALVLLAHPGGLDRMRPRLLERAGRLAAAGFASATIELPGSGDRPRLPGVERARADLRRAETTGGPIADIVDRLVPPLVEAAVPEWQAAITALLELPDLRGPVGYSGGVAAIGVRLAAVDPRVAAASIFAGSLVPDGTFDDARRISIPMHVLLQWDDAGNDRGRSLELFDALGSREKTLYASMGGHLGVPAWAGEDAVRFFSRHLGTSPGERR